MTEGGYRLSDFRVINEGQNPFSPEDSLRLFNESRVCLSSKLDEKHEGKTAVVRLKEFRNLFLLAIHHSLSLSPELLISKPVQVAFLEHLATTRCS